MHGLYRASELARASRGSYHGEVLRRLQRAAVQPNVEAERHNRSGFLCAPVEGVHDTADEATTVRAQQLYLLSKPCTTEIYLHLELPAQ